MSERKTRGGSKQNIQAIKQSIAEKTGSISPVHDQGSVFKFKAQ